MTTTATTAASSSYESFEVIIVGAGVAGCSAAYHLHHKGGVTNMLVLDSGPSAGEGVHPRYSGSATMDDTVAPCIKMMVQVFASTTKEMTRHHGKDGPARYLRAAEQGLNLQKTIAKEIWRDDTSLHMKELGSYWLAYAQDEAEFKEEFEALQALGCNAIEWCDTAKLQSVKGMSSHFHCGIFFPKEAVIDSSLYAKSLLQYTLDKCEGQAQFWPDSQVKQVQETAQGVLVELISGKTLLAKQVVMATGAMYQDPKLNGLLQPCFSYLVHVPIDTTECDCSPNFFTWGFTHDWCFVNGKIRISGEDHFSAYKPPHLEERCANLSQWALEHYQCNTDNIDLATFPQQYGLYSETPDMVPLLGRLTPNSRVCYLLGCNAWGQSILSYCSSLVPGLLEYAKLTDEQQDCLKLLSIQRFSQLPAVLE
jgi:glycine/D-amino acid oxidase-like deaminating enzyme